MLIYSNGGSLYGRMMATINLDTGLVDDTIATKTFKTDALAGDPPNCGLDFVYELQARSKDYKGSIIDPGDGKVYEGANWTRLVYAGDGLFSSEEDVYNPAHFAPMLEGWLAAYAAHHPDAPHGPGSA